MVDRHNRSIVQYTLRLSSNGTGRRNNKIGLYDRGSLPFRCGLLCPERKGPTGGWVERRAKRPTLIESFHLPHKIDCLRRSPQLFSAVAPSSIVGRRGSPRSP